MSFYTNNIAAQTRIAVYKLDLSEFKKGFSKQAIATNKYFLTNIPDQIVQFYANDKRFKVIDRINKNLIQKEQELQKSESFINGYVVQQGKQEGADFIFYTKYFQKEKKTYT